MMMQIQDITSNVIVNGIKLFEQHEAFKLNPVYDLLKKDPENFYLITDIIENRLYIGVQGFSNYIRMVHYNIYSAKDVKAVHICKLIIKSFNECRNGTYRKYNGTHLFNKLKITQRVRPEVLDKIFSLDFDELYIKDNYIARCPDGNLKLDNWNDMDDYYNKYMFKGTRLFTSLASPHLLPYGPNVEYLALRYYDKSFYYLLKFLYPSLKVLHVEMIMDFYDFSSTNIKALIIDYWEDDYNHLLNGNHNIDIIISDNDIMYSNNKYIIDKKLLCCRKYYPQAFIQAL